MRRFPRRHSRTPKKSTKQWIQWETIETGTNFHRPFLLGPGQSASNWIMDPGYSRLYFGEPTIVRTIFSIWLTAVMPNFDAGTFEAQFWSGLIIVRDAGGIPNLDPSNGTHDWLWWRSFHFSSIFTALGTPVRLGHLYFQDSWGPQGGAFDLRSKRKIPDGHGLAMYNFCMVAPDNIGASVMGYTTGRALMLSA